MYRGAVAVPILTDIGGTLINLLRFTRQDSKTWSAFNPSIAYSSTQGYAMTVRSSNYYITPKMGELVLTEGTDIRNEVWFTETNTDLEVLNLRKIDFAGVNFAVERGVEDAKLFNRNNEWFFTGVILEKSVPVARVGLFHLDPQKSIATLIKLHSGQNAKKPEKNWMAPYEENEHFDYVYSANAIVKNSLIVTAMSDDTSLAPLRGNTNLYLLENGTYLAIMHILRTVTAPMFDSRTFGMRNGVDKFYTHLFVNIDSRGKLIAKSKEFNFASSGIEFAAGIVSMGEDFVVTFGKNDVSSHAIRISKTITMGMLVPVSH